MPVWLAYRKGEREREEVGSKVSRSQGSAGSALVQRDREMSCCPTKENNIKGHIRIDQYGGRGDERNHRHRNQPVTTNKATTVDRWKEQFCYSRGEEMCQKKRKPKVP